MEPTLQVRTYLIKVMQKLNGGGTFALSVTVVVISIRDSSGGPPYAVPNPVPAAAKGVDLHVPGVSADAIISGEILELNGARVAVLRGTSTPGLLQWVFPERLAPGIYIALVHVQEAGLQPRVRLAKISVLR